MMNLFILSVLVGAVLGMRLRVMILVPAIGFFLIGIAAIGTARSDQLSSIAAAAVLAAISLQLGYLAGSATRFVMLIARKARRIEGSAKRSQVVHQAFRP